MKAIIRHFIIPFLLPSTLLFTIIFTYPSSGSAEDETAAKSPLQTKLCSIEKITEPVFGGQLYLAECGDKNKPSVVLIHGIGSDASRVWDSLLAVLAKNYHVLTFDLPGFGRSGRLNRLYSPDTYSDLVKWIIDTRAGGRGTLIGHSMGATIAIHCTGKYPSAVEKLIVADAAGILHRVALVKSYISPGKKNPLADKPIRIVDYWMKSIVEKVDKSFMPKKFDTFLKNRFFRKSVLDGDPQKTAGLALINFNITETLLNIKKPVYIMWGRKDNVAPLRTARLLTWLLPDSKLKILRGCGHTPMEDKPKVFNKLVRKYLKAGPEEIKKPKKPAPPFKKDTLTLSSLNNQTFSSLRAKHIVLKECQNLTIKKLTAESVSIIDSSIKTEHCTIKSTGAALDIKNSIFTATGFTISGTTGIKVYNSNIDLAGGSIHTSGPAIISTYKTSLVLSVCKIHSRKNRGFFHLAKTLYAKDEL